MDIFWLVLIYVFIIMIIEIGLSLRTLFKFNDERYIDRSFNPTVSIIIPAYNEEKSIISAVRSALNQTYPAEVIVVDDGSTDFTLFKLRENFEHNPSVKIIHKENGGKFDALNKGIEEASGDWILAVDADSFLIPTTLETIVNKKRPNAVAVTTGIGVINESEIKDGKLINRKVPNKPLVISQMIEYIRTFVLLKMSLNDKNGVTVMSGVCSFFNKKFVKDIGGYRDRITEDSELTLRIHENGGDVQFISDILSYTEVPSTVKQLHRQRMRWIRGIFRDIWEHKSKVETPSIKWFLIPYYFIVHYILPWMEIGGWLAMIVTLFFYPIGITLSLYILSAVYILYLINTMTILSISLYKMNLLKEYEGKWKLFAYSAIDVFYYRPILLFFTIKAQLMELFQVESTWGNIKRKGF